MTKEQYLNKVDELSDTTAEMIREKVRTVLKSGAIELSNWQDDYRLPKLVLHALCKEMAWQWQPLTETDRKEAENLKYFV